MLNCAVGGPGTPWTAFGYGPDTAPLSLARNVLMHIPERQKSVTMHVLVYTQ